MFAIQTIRIAVLLAIVFLFDKCSGYPSIRQGTTSYCLGCGDSCHKCKYGIAMSSACGIVQCAKGPDELCGGPQNYLGICAEGMQCSCNKCIGCSAEKFECSKTSNPCLPHRNSDRDLNIRKWSSIAINWNRFINLTEYRNRRRIKRQFYFAIIVKLYIDWSNIVTLP